MIYKDLDPFHSDDKFARSGRAAEEQMAFYLKRFFGDDPEMLVLNGIRLADAGDAAQVDHLVIHSHGLSIIESKSVHGKVQIKDDGQWIRWYGENQSKGIASPQIQARLQEKFFRRVLGKASSNEALFAAFPVDTYVAISDSGVILWPKSGPVAGVCKADQVPDRIITKNQQLAAQAGALALSAANRERIAGFLKAANAPLVRAVQHPASVVTPLPVQDIAAAAPAALAAGSAAVDVPPETPSKSGEARCSHCGSSALEIRFGYTYYFHCLSCEKKMPAKATCPKCKEPAKLRKDKKEFFAECGKCWHSERFHVNA